VRLMLDNFHSFTVSLLSYLFKKKNLIFVYNSQSRHLNQKGKKKVKKCADYKERAGRKKGRRRKRVLGGLDWTVGGDWR
jgi:hypothetical protein